MIFDSPSFACCYTCEIFVIRSEDGVLFQHEVNRGLTAFAHFYLQPRLGCISAKRACHAVPSNCSLVLCGRSRTCLTFSMILRTFNLSDRFSSSRVWIDTPSNAESSQFSLAAASFSAAVLRFRIYLNVEWVTPSSVPDFTASLMAFANARICLSCVRSALRNILFLFKTDCPICIV